MPRHARPIRSLDLELEPATLLDVIAYLVQRVRRHPAHDGPSCGQLKGAGPCGGRWFRQRWGTRDELRLAIVTWIERIHHRGRRQAQLGRLTPIESEATITLAADQAA